METKRVKARIEEMLIRGITSRRDIATRLGLNEAKACIYVAEIYDRWELESIERLRDLRTQAIKRCEKAASLAMLSYERSRKDAEEVNVTYNPVVCKECKGTGMKGDTLQWCESCEGSGRVMQETTLKRTKGQAGDPAHLRVYLDSVREAARLQGLYGKMGRPKKNEAEGGINVSGNAIVIGNVDLNRVPQDKLLAAMSAYDQLMEASKAKEDPKVIDV